MLIDSYLNNKEPNIKSPNNKNDFIFIDDVVKILIFMLQSSLPSGVYNVGTGVATEVIELSNIIKNFFNSNCNLKKNIKKKADEQTINFFADTNKLKKYFSNLEFEKINSGLYKTVKSFTTKEQFS
jgi:nucleoside-diphosphate-sugar epimerase